MRRSRLADQGSEWMTIYPEKVITDRRGNQVTTVDEDNPVRLRASVSTDRQSDAELPGFVSNKVLNVIVRSAPAGSWARIEFRGEEWDLATPPVFSNFTKASRHVEMTLRSRNAVLSEEP